MALALYRKYRPRTFAEIIGQEHVTEPLSQALRSDRLHHAYLFSGPRGCGKTSSARILARSLNCEKGPTPDPCGECDSCRALAPDGAGSIDVIEIDAASHGGVDDARDLRERAFFAPVSSRFKIYVIDEAHMVSSAGFNALLKLVEEPPEYVKFVFATTEPEKVLGTIKSRTHHYPFRLIPPGTLRPYLEQLCVTEGVAVEPAVFPLVVRAGGGSARDSLSVLDQLIAGAGAEGVTYARAVALLGVTDVALIDEVCDALAAGDGRAVYTTIDRVAEAGHDARRFAGDLLERLRDLIVLQQVPDAVAKGLLDGADDELARMTVQSQQFGPATLSRMADIVHTGLTDMRGTTAPRLVLELITARMLLPGSDDSTAALLARMERMERRLTLAGGDAPQMAADPQPPVVRATTHPAPPAAPTPAPVVTPTAVPAAGSASAGTAGPGPTPVAGASGASAAASSESGGAAAAPAPASVVSRGSGTAEENAHPAVSTLSATSPAAAAGDAMPARAEQPPGAIDAAAVRRIWEEVLTMVHRKSRRAAAVIRGEATVRDVDGDVVVLTFKHAFHAESVAAAPELLIDALYEVLGGRWRVRCEVSGQPGRPETAAGPGRASGRPAQGGSAPSTSAAPTAPAQAPSSDATVQSTVLRPSDGSDTDTARTTFEPDAHAGVTVTSSAASSALAASLTASGRAAPVVSPNAESPELPASGATGPASVISGTAAAGITSPDPIHRTTSPVTTNPSAAIPRASASAAPANAARSEPTSASAPEGKASDGKASDGKASGSNAPESEEEDWPTPAPLGGSGADGGAAPAPAEPARPVAAARRAAPPAREASPSPRGGSGGPAGSGRTAARAAAAGRAGSTRPAGRDDAWAGSNGEEPPYDPEFDPPVAGPGGPLGFDPGDEPVDDDDPAVRQTSEQQALELLRETLGAERIGD